MPLTAYCTVVLISLSHSSSYMTSLFLEWPIFRGLRSCKVVKVLKLRQQTFGTVGRRICPRYLSSYQTGFQFFNYYEIINAVKHM